jgi:hypothetical protein
MMIKLFDENLIPCINIVRREEQVELLKKETTARVILNSSNADFEKTLYDLAQ